MDHGKEPSRFTNVQAAATGQSYKVAIQLGIGVFGPKPCDIGLFGRTKCTVRPSEIACFNKILGVLTRCQRKWTVGPELGRVIVGEGLYLPDLYIDRLCAAAGIGFKLADRQRITTTLIKNHVLESVVCPESQHRGRGCLTDLNSVDLCLTVWNCCHVCAVL